MDLPLSENHQNNADSNQIIVDSNQIMEILKDIQLQMRAIESKIDALNKTSTNVEEDCHQMRNHINFVENTYKVVRTPLNYITNKLNNFIHNTAVEQELPMIENSDTT